MTAHNTQMRKSNTKTTVFKAKWSFIKSGVCGGVQKCTKSRSVSKWKKCKKKKRPDKKTAVSPQGL